jgi:PAS domain S-box-containing protein
MIPWKNFYFTKSKRARPLNDSQLVNSPSLLKKPWSQLPLSVALMICYGGQVFLVLGIISYFSYQSGQRSAEDLGTQMMDQMAARVEGHLREYTALPKLATQTNYDAIQAGELPLTHVRSWDRYLFRQSQVLGYLSYIYYGNQAGEYIEVRRVHGNTLRYGFGNDRQSKNRQSKDHPNQVHIYQLDHLGKRIKRLRTVPYDARQRPWYQVAAQTGIPKWTPIYQFKEIQPTLGITYVRPVYQNGKLEGVLGADFALVHTNDFLKSLKLLDGSQIMIVERDGRLVASSSGEQPFDLQQRRIRGTELQNPLIRATAQELQSRLQSGFHLPAQQQFSFVLQGQKQLVRVMPFNEESNLDWLIVTMVPEQSFLGAIPVNQRNLIWLSGLATLLTVGTSILTARWLTKPLQTLTIASQAIAAGQLEQPFTLPPSSQEVNTLASNFERMRQELYLVRDRLADYAHLLEARVHERTQALQASETQFRTLVGNIPGVVFRCYWDQQWQLDFINDEVEALTGYSAEAWTAQFQAIHTELIHPDDRLLKKNVIDQAVNNRAAYTIDYRIIRPDGMTRWLRERGQGLFHPDGHLQWLDGVIFDITAQKQLEAEREMVLLDLAEKNITLQQTLNELQTTQTQLMQAEKMSMLGQLVASVAHEINTPLGAIQSSIQSIGMFLQQDLEVLPTLLQTLSPSNRQHFFALLNRSILFTQTLSSREKRRLRQTLVQQLEVMQVDDAITIADTLVEMGIHDHVQEFHELLQSQQGHLVLKTLDHLTSSQRSVSVITEATQAATKVIRALRIYAYQDRFGTLTPVDVIQNLEIALVLYQNQIKRGITLVRAYEVMPMLWGWPDELNQVWTNLIQNAIHAMDGTGTLTIAVHQDDSQTTLCFTNTGSMIEPEVRDRMFEPFFTTKPIGIGNGLGLSIVQRVLDHHHGRIAVDSNPDRTQFTVILPNDCRQTCET